MSPAGARAGRCSPCRPIHARAEASWAATSVIPAAELTKLGTTEPIQSIAAKLVATP